MSNPKQPDSNSNLADCSQCGEPTKEFLEGYCHYCQQANQRELDEHIWRERMWREMTDEQREQAIRNACKEGE